MQKEKDRLQNRGMGFLMLCVSVFVIGLALKMEPASGGVGTHKQLGLPSCAWMSYGVPCPSCGMTTAVSYCVRGSFFKAFATQPAGVFFGLAIGVVGILGFWIVITGTSFSWIIPYVFSSFMGWSLVIIVIFSWLYKIVIVRGNAG